MVAYNFKAEFAGAVSNGQKHLTLREPRAGRSRHARVGEPVQLTTGARSKAVRRLLSDPRCILRAHVVLGPLGVVRVRDIVAAEGSTRAQGVAMLLAQAEQGSPEAARWSNALGKLDGFDDYAGLYAWHAANGAKAGPDAAGYLERELIGWAA